jgi:acetamidase/formamidase
MIHALEPDDRTLHGYFSRELAPVLTIDPGDTVVFRTLDSGWGLEPHAPGPYRPRREIERAAPHSGHALTGPVAIRGARPGMTLQVDIGEIVPGAYGDCLAGGWESAHNRRFGVVGDGVVHAYTLDAATMTGTSHLGRTVRLRPFLGVMGMPPDAPGIHSTIPPRVTGGNLDCRELVAGSTLYLPIAVPGGLFSAGDGHAAQGDGEVSGTAIECPVEHAELTFSLRDDLPLTTPIAHTPAGWLTIGLHERLDEAAEIALNAMLALLEREFGLSRRDALAVASIEVDLRVTQIVNEVQGVHAVLRSGA